jgi:hypothetical protein
LPKTHSLALRASIVVVPFFKALVDDLFTNLVKTGPSLLDTLSGPKIFYFMHKLIFGRIVWVVANVRRKSRDGGSAAYSWSISKAAWPKLPSRKRSRSRASYER